MSHRSSKTAINLASRAHRRQAPEVRRPPRSIVVNRLQRPKAFLKTTRPIKKQVAKLGIPAEQYLQLSQVQESLIRIRSEPTLVDHDHWTTQEVQVNGNSSNTKDRLGDIRC
ncbi:BQ5605_C001g00373 [Microbotryum silenes-dioicae]|uniref:BQ5605_C001g00085 protein n=1 Tax=Microbotryum silenes-dioicae TaxID=796604 RepID=A0A2X0M347_9BASI|nr:BQ5605_C001g00085 [Microbotryum silenes-dioicae]SGY46026.1 BQ5605_C001g00373 [Microbotryum silenes-dioicae]